MDNPHTPHETQENLTLKERREQKRQEKLQRREGAHKESTYRAWLWLAVVVVLIGVIFAMVKIVKNAPNPSGNTGVQNVLGTITGKEWVSDNPNAQTTLIEYSDFQCPACAAYYPVLKRIHAELGKDLKFVYRHFPLPQHQNAPAAARAAEAAGLQGKFFEMHDMLFENQTEWSESPKATDMFVKYAEKLGLNMEKFKKDVASKEVADRVAADMKTGNDLQVNATPTFFLNNTKLPSPRSYEEFRAMIQNGIASSTTSRQ